MGGPRGSAFAYERGTPVREKDEKESEVVESKKKKIRRERVLHDLPPHIRIYSPNPPMYVSTSPKII